MQIYFKTDGSPQDDMSIPPLYDIDEKIHNEAFKEIVEENDAFLKRLSKQ